MDITCIYDQNRQPQMLGQRLGGGGEGEVYRLQQRPDLAVKVYHADKLATQGKVLREKIDAQIALYHANADLRNLPLAWPRLAVFNEKGEWIGYAMKAVQGIPMSSLAHPIQQREKLPSLTRRGIVRRLRPLLDCISTLHRHGVFIGDINLNNFLIEPACENNVWFIDCDSMQVRGANGRLHPCLVGVGEFTAPEHQGVEFAKAVRNAESDGYSLAVLIFKCFMHGRHPFDQVGGDAPERNMKKGHFPYGKNGIRPGSDGSVPQGPWYSQWSWLSYNLKDAFIQTFVEGGQQPQNRTGVAQWQKLLKEYDYSITHGKGGLCDELRPPHPKPQGSVSRVSISQTRVA